MVGPSGAGKSSLLGVLAGRKATGVVGGEVFLNGSKASNASRRHLVGYVTQDDVLPGTSTIQEHLHFHAALRLSWLSSDRRSTLVKQVLTALRLDLVAHRSIGDAYVRGLSGGERRRVSVAVELIVLGGGGSGSVTHTQPAPIQLTTHSRPPALPP